MALGGDSGKLLHVNLIWLVRLERGDRSGIP